MNKLVILLLPTAIFAQNPPDARALLVRADAALFTAKTVRVAATSMRAPGTVNPTTILFKLELVRGGRGRGEYRSSVTNAPISLYDFDGTNTWEYNSALNAYTKKPAKAFFFEGVLATLDYGRKASNITSASYEPDATVNFNGLPVACYVVRAEYRGSPSNALAKGVVRRVWISKEGELILRDEWEGPLSFSFGPNNNREKETINYTTIETDIALPDDLFVFQPPPGSKLADNVLIGGIAGGLAPDNNTAPPPPPPPPPKSVEANSSQRIPVGGAVQQAKLIRRVTPVYPALAKQGHVQGVVRLRAVIARDGTVQELSPISGHPLLTPPAIEAVKKWVYQPTTNNGEPVEVITEIDVTFSLGQ